MSLTRVYTALNQLIINKLGDVGGPSSSRVDEELNRIIAWAKLSPRVTFVDTADHGNVLAVPTLVANVSIVAGTLANNDFFEYVAEFDLANNANNKLVALRFGGQAVGTIDWNNTFASVGVMFTVRVYRVTATTIRCYSAVSLPNLGGAQPSTSFAARTVANMDSNNLDFQVTLAATATNDIVHRVSHMAIVSRS